MCLRRQTHVADDANQCISTRVLLIFVRRYDTKVFSPPVAINGGIKVAVALRMPSRHNAANARNG